jgi:hypothetical protein
MRPDNHACTTENRCYLTGFQHSVASNLERLRRPQVKADLGGSAIQPHIHAGPYGDVVMFSPELREGVAAGDITVSIRLWQQAKVKTGGRYASHGAVIEVDAVELLPFSAVTADDVARSGDRDLDALRRRAAHAGPIGDDTLVYRLETTSPRAGSRE